MKKFSFLCLLILTMLVAVPAVLASSQYTGTSVNGNFNYVEVNANQYSTEEIYNQAFYFPTSTSHSLVDIGYAPGNVMSISKNKPLILPIYRNNQTVNGWIVEKPDGNKTLVRSLDDSRFYKYRIGDDNFRLLMPGEIWAIEWFASDPVYVYGIPGRERGRVANVDGAPIGDSIRQTYDHQGLITVSGSDSMQLAREGTVYLTAEDLATYAFVIDPRVTDQLDGRQMMPNNADTLEVWFYIHQYGYEDPAEEVREKIGFISTYPTDSYGRVITA